GHPSHPGTSRMLAEEAFAAAGDTGMPAATIQLVYRTDPATGIRLVSDPRIGACGFTGSRTAGLKLKAAADGAGKPIYLELSSVNPVVFLPGALQERGEKLAEEFAASCLLGGGQFCTNPGFVVLVGSGSDAFISTVKQRFDAATPPPLLSSGVVSALTSSVKALQAAGAELATGGSPLPPPGFRHANTLLRVSGSAFLAQPHALQTEAFGSASLVVVCKDAA